MNQLPAHLQRFQAPDVGAALSANLGSAMPPHVSIEGGRFKLIDASNNEIPVPTFDPAIGVYLDACIIDVNQHMSRMYYIADYDPAAAGSPPDCWSDNGTAPSISASSPQSPTCAACPMAVWGSKISNLGSKIPACSQKQKTALLVPGFQTLFLLAVPPNSHKFMREYVERSRGSGVNLADVITRISFVPGVQGTLQFSPVNYIDEPTAVLRQAAYAEKKTDALVGRNDVPRTAGAIAAPQTAAPNQGAGDLNRPMPAPQIAMQQPAAFGQHQQVQQPGPFVATPAAGAAAPVGQWPQNPAQPAATTSPSEPAPAARRKRRTAAEMQTAQPQPGGPAAAPQAPFPHPGQAVNAAPQQLDAFPAPGQPGNTAAGTFGMAAGQPAAANPEMSQMLDSFFKG